MKRGTVLEVDNLSAGYGDGDVVHSISFDLAEGEIIGIVGPNGSGKSTLLKALTRALPGRTGQVHLLGKDLTAFGSNELARTLSLVPQSAILPEGFSALELTLMGRTPYLRLLQSEGPADLAVARRSMLQTDTLDLSERLVSELSGGERQRVVIARALTQQAPILLMDEPTVHLDIGHQIALLDLVAELVVNQSLAVIAVVHDLTLAAQYCDRLMLLNEGVVYSCGAVSDVLLPDTIRDVYDVEVRVIEHPDTGRPVVLPVRGR